MILDYVDNLELPKDIESKYINHINYLNNLKVGLSFLYQQVRNIENAIIEPGIRVFATGEIPGVPQNTQSLITCSFHWYAVSAYNYVLLVGWLLQQVNKDFENPKKYAHRVMPQLEKYRHKVAAHLAIVKPEKDNKADFIEDFLPVTLGSKGFFVGSWKTTIRSKSQVESGQHDFCWGLTETHKMLSERFWPE